MMRLPAHGDQRRVTGRHIGGAEVTGIGVPGQHRFKLAVVVACLNHVRRHHGLRIVALVKTAIGDLHDARPFIGEVDLFVGLGPMARRRRWLAAELFTRPLALSFRAASTAACSVRSRSKRCFALTSILVRASAIFCSRSSQRASASEIDMPSGTSAWSAASTLAMSSATSAFCCASIMLACS